MRAVITIDDELYAKALEAAEPGLDIAGIFHEALKTYVRIQAARRLAALGGTAPHIQIIPRRFDSAIDTE